MALYIWTKHVGIRGFYYPGYTETMNKLPEKKFPSSPGKLILIVAVAVFISKSISMAVIFALQPFFRSDLTETLFDSSLLIALLGPILYFFIFRPMLRHIYERRQAEESLRKLNEELCLTASELALAYKDMESFSQSVSHDLRAPLRIIGGFSDIIVNDYYDRLDEDGRNLLKGRDMAFITVGGYSEGGENVYYVKDNGGQRRSC